MSPLAVAGGPNRPEHKISLPPVVLYMLDADTAMGKSVRSWETLGTAVMKVILTVIFILIIVVTIVLFIIRLLLSIIILLIIKGPKLMESTDGELDLDSNHKAQWYSGGTACLTLLV